MRRQGGWIVESQERSTGLWIPWFTFRIRKIRSETEEYVINTSATMDLEECLAYVGRICNDFSIARLRNIYTDETIPAAILAGH